MHYIINWLVQFVLYSALSTVPMFELSGKYLELSRFSTYPLAHIILGWIKLWFAVLTAETMAQPGCQMFSTQAFTAFSLTNPDHEAKGEAPQGTFVSFLFSLGKHLGHWDRCVVRYCGRLEHFKPVVLIEMSLWVVCWFQSTYLAIRTLPIFLTKMVSIPGTNNYRMHSEALIWSVAH